jgi:putative ABC transport system substrate-binding protein
LPHAAAKATEAAAPEAAEAATTASTRCMAGTPTYGYACGKLAQRVPEGSPMLDVRRRQFITLLGGAAATWPVVGVAETLARPLVGCLIAGSKAGTERVFGGFLQGMRDLGYVEGQNWTFEGRYADGDQTRAPSLAEELVRIKPDVLVSGAMAGVVASKKFTDTIPIVSPILVDPVGLGFARSHARPGGNVTGVLLTVEDLPSKQLALAVEMIPNARKVGLLVNPGNLTHEAQRPNIEAAAATLGIELIALQTRLPDDLHAAFDKLTRERVAMVLALPDGMFLNERKRIALLAMAARLPTMFAAECRRRRTDELRH